MQRRFPRTLADARAYPHGYAAVHRVRWHIYRKEDAAYLPSRSTSLSQRNCPGRRGRSPASSFPREKQGKGSKERGGGRARERKESGRRPYITAHEKRPSTGRLISEALPPAPFTGSTNPQPGHESRHSAASFCFPPLSHPSCPSQTYGYGARR